MLVTVVLTNMLLTTDTATIRSPHKILKKSATKKVIKMAMLFGANKNTVPVTIKLLIMNKTNQISFWCRFNII